MTHEDVVAMEKMSVGCAVGYLVYGFPLVTRIDHTILDRVSGKILFRLVGVSRET